MEHLLILIILIIIVILLTIIASIWTSRIKHGGARSIKGATSTLSAIRELIFCRDFIDVATIDKYCDSIVKKNTNYVGITSPLTASQVRAFGIMELSMITKYHRDHKKLEELKKLVKNTIFDNNYRTQINIEAYAFEVVVENKLKQLTTAPFKNEQQLRAEGSPLTPDFLFSKEAPFLYNGIEVYWIDAKNYPCYDSKMTHFKLIAQSNKYTDKFGQGMFIFNGIWKNIKIENTIICDYNTL